METKIKHIKNKLLKQNGNWNFGNTFNIRFKSKQIKEMFCTYEKPPEKEIYAYKLIYIYIYHNIFTNELYFFNFTLW